MAAWLCSSSSSGAGQPRSTASRMRCSDPTPGLPPQEKTSLRAAPIADHLIVEDVGRHPDQRQIAALLTNHLVPGREWDEVRESFHRHHVAILDEPSDGL